MERFGEQYMWSNQNVKMIAMEAARETCVGGSKP